MIKYTIGDVIRKERKLLGLSQEQLSEGICTSSWLSKIESGACIPTHAIFECLMQRLGKNSSQYILYQSELEMEIDKLKFETRRLYSTSALDEAKESFEALKELIREENRQDMQFKLLYDILLYKDKDSTPETLLELLKEAILYSIPTFDEKKISSYLLSKDEMVIINNIALSKYRIGHSKEAISILKQLRTYLENPKFDYEEKRRTYPLVMYNLSKWLKIEKDYTECLSTTTQAIEFCIKYDAHSETPYLLFYKASALAELGSMKLARKTFIESYHLFTVFKEHSFADHTLKFAKESYEIDFYDLVKD